MTITDFKKSKKNVKLDILFRKFVENLGESFENRTTSLFKKGPPPDFNRMTFEAVFVFVFEFSRPKQNQNKKI